ncbi:hypothetical protein M422DRAFT_125766, partial [Sphaerobolus stellatus SS14]
WYPWPDKESCVIDILRHIPRCAFSDSQHEAIQWCLAALGISNIPSVRVAKDIDEALQSSCGIETKRYEGPLGHIYYVNDIAGIIAQEFANPRVHPYLHVYPEDTGKKVYEARQASKWLHEASAELLTPMARVGNQDFFIYEPALCYDGSACMPHRFYMKNGELHAKVWPLQAAHAKSGWYVREDWEKHIRVSELAVSWPDFVATYSSRDLPDPRLVLGTYQPLTWAVQKWTKSEAREGNKWRAKAKNHRVYSYPIWLYCDDTSGNVSKKWNKHNSYLFTAAGLPRKQVLQEYNVLYLTTSNLAPPLEMLDGISSQLGECQENGIWAWDCVNNSLVLVIPWVLAFLGDNPMQSEICCHRGLMAKFFCRVCGVWGTQTREESEAESTEPLAEASSAGASEGELTGSSEVPQLNGRKSRRKQKKLESLTEMSNRVRRFLQKGEPRTAVQTQASLHSIWDLATKASGKTASQKMAKECGLKDTYQLFFMEMVWNACKSLRRTLNKDFAINILLAKLPLFPMSPVWRIKSIDPHADTPVEILHVILLGCVKYFWRDVMLRISNDEKNILAARLSSMEVSALGIPPVAGKTLVNYAGSLTGRDFRVIAQVAPFCIYDMVPSECYNTWLALGKLVPLVWQPEIEDIDEHIRKLEQAIDVFLLCTAKWMPRWFNKPKFHILLHLPDHVRRFGPASLFATEGFESFNAVIRAASVHSNRQAPSRDIGRAFARSNHIRHMLSGSYFL